MIHNDKWVVLLTRLLIASSKVSYQVANAKSITRITWGELVEVTIKDDL